MILDKTITIQSLSVSFNNERMEVQTWSATQTTALMNRQPFLDNTQTFESPGVSNIKITEIFFCDPNTTINNNYKNGILTRLVDGSETFLIKRQEIFANHYELLVEPVIE